ncbi:MAG: integrase, partial [bacterium]|nr:integrase [bacterium]
MKDGKESLEFASLPLDDQFLLLLHKKTMDKTGVAKRMMKKYYKDAYKKTGVIPKPLLLAGQGVVEGRKCSGRARVLSPEVRERFVEMVKVSSDINDPSFMFITREARCIKNYHKWLEEEFNQRISLPALYR